MKEDFKSDRMICKDSNVPAFVWNIRHTSSHFIRLRLARTGKCFAFPMRKAWSSWWTMENEVGTRPPHATDLFSLRAMLMFYLFLCYIAALSLDILNDWSNRYRRYVGRRSDAESWRISNLDTSIPEHVEIEMLSFHPCYTLSCWFWIGAWREELQGAQQIQQIQHNTIDTRFFTASWC